MTSSTKAVSRIWILKVSIILRYIYRINCFWTLSSIDEEVSALTQLLFTSFELEGGSNQFASLIVQSRDYEDSMGWSCAIQLQLPLLTLLHQHLQPIEPYLTLTLNSSHVGSQCSIGNHDRPKKTSYFTNPSAFSAISTPHLNNSLIICNTLNSLGNASHVLHDMQISRADQ